MIGWETDSGEAEGGGLERGERVFWLWQCPAPEAQQGHAQLRLQVQLRGDQRQGGEFMTAFYTLTHALVETGTWRGEEIKHEREMVCGTTVRNE